MGRRQVGNPRGRWLPPPVTAKSPPSKAEPIPGRGPLAAPGPAPHRDRTGWDGTGRKTRGSSWRLRAQRDGRDLHRHRDLPWVHLGCPRRAHRGARGGVTSVDPPLCPPVSPPVFLVCPRGLFGVPPGVPRVPRPPRDISRRLPAASGVPAGLASPSRPRVPQPRSPPGRAGPCCPQRRNPGGPDGAAPALPAPARRGCPRPSPGMDTGGGAVVGLGGETRGRPAPVGLSTAVRCPGDSLGPCGTPWDTSGCVGWQETA
ncbi:atherin-like [Corapipo altera]|uniref:atherin-like n=1 Tax=Corapipo altera TaxID=415028 RepID=UPI000FD62AE9|nr:atherin-like [Corapipo altera]